MLRDAITHQFNASLRREPDNSEMLKYLGFLSDTLKISDKTSALKKMMVSVLREPEFLYLNDNKNRVVSTKFIYRVPGKVSKEADTLVEWVLKKDEDVLKTLLTTDQCFVHPSKLTRTSIMNNRRDFLKTSAAGLFGIAGASSLPPIFRTVAASPVAPRFIFLRKSNGTFPSELVPLSLSDADKKK